jgi:predicted nucleotidyltransferase
MASPALIQRAGEALAAAAGSSAKVILFGSHARGKAQPDSDVDFLVIEPTLEDRFGETVRLGKLVGELGVPADVIVVSEDHVREWGELRGTMLHDALTQGRVLVGAGS